MLPSRNGERKHVIESTKKNTLLFCQYFAKLNKTIRDTYDKYSYVIYEALIVST